MREYNVHFSYYSKDYGLFCDKKYSMEAESQFEARRHAWKYTESDNELKNVVNLKQIGVTWQSTPLDIQDYFNSEAAEIKLEINRIKNVTIPQIELDNESDLLKDKYNYLYQYFGMLYELDEIANGLYRGIGIVPPSIYEEIQYAKLISEELYNSGKYDEADSLNNIANDAINWKKSKKHTLKQLFENGYYYHYGEKHLEQFFHKDSIFPERYSIKEEYIRKPKKIEKLYQLPIFTEKDIHSGSKEMFYQGEVLVLNSEKLKKEIRT